MKRGCVIVTGASKGIGSAIASALALEGFTVGCLSRSGGRPSFNSRGTEKNASLITAGCDVTDHASIKRAFKAIVEQSKLPLVGLVNNAGLHMEGKSDVLPIEEFEKVMNANASSVLMASQAAFPYFEATGGGTIVNIGSFFDKIGVKRNVAYCASKAAVGAITRCLAVEWASQGIRVHNVAPGYIATDLNRDSMFSGPLSEFLAKRIPTGHPGAADDVAELVKMLFTLKGRFITGETLYIDGGQGMAL